MDDGVLDCIVLKHIHNILSNPTDIYKGGKMYGRDVILDCIRLQRCSCNAR